MAHDHAHEHAHEAHAHAAPHAGAVPSGDPHALPPEPARRLITPAPQDFARTPPLRYLLWPLVWAAVVVTGIRSVRAYGWHVPAHDGHGAPAAPGRTPGH